MKKWLLVLSVMFMHEYAMAAWGAIAFDTKTGNWGTSRGWYNHQQAESNAITACGALNCKVYVTANSGYLGLAISKSDKGFAGFSKAPSKFETMYLAMYYCNQGPSSCTLRATFPVN